ncbi:isoprenoid synthase domain-containing protein [Rhodocollybia butyracea]|uniref:Isoprenoid synthase domain-containing protein n=1 Tax=Rhodocollybia butyracea TaxID=206335 RepID=A0A9P5PBP4_9AGAR|nr:isoprenoid synthase domain-containing protein [Rhodocollybia butyracea]
MSVLLGKSVFPPARQHPRTPELVKICEEYFFKRWPFESEAARQHFIQSDLVGFTAKCQSKVIFLGYSDLTHAYEGIPDTDHWERLVLAGKVFTWAFLLDDMMDVEVLYNTSMKDLLKIVYGTKKPNPNHHWEVIGHEIWRDIERSCTALEFDQITRAFKEWYNSQGLPRPENFDDWLTFRFYNSSSNWTWSIARYAMDCHITDEELAHPVVREAEDSGGVTAILVNDIVSVTKDKMHNCEKQNGVIMIQKCGRVSTEEEAFAGISDIVVRRSRQMMEAVDQALADPMMSSEIKRWMTGLLYVVTGNSWWSQLFPRCSASPRMTINIEGEGDKVLEPIHRIQTVQPESSNDLTDRLRGGLPQFEAFCTDEVTSLYMFTTSDGHGQLGKITMRDSQG